MRNKQIWDIVLTAALGSHLSNLDQIDTDPDTILQEIEESDGEWVWPNHILVWEPFENYRGEALAELIVGEAQCRYNNIAEVAEAIKGHIVDLACSDLLPLDLTELDLVGWVKYGFGNELEADDKVLHTVGSSHGMLQLNKSGFVVGYDITCAPVCENCIDQIHWFDLCEWATFWKRDWVSLQSGLHFDILDLAGNLINGSKFPADETHREITQAHRQEKK